MASAPSHYAALGLPRDFTPELLKKNYRALALRWHPDRNHGNEEEATEKFKAINEAFNVLSDPAQRRDYDLELMLRRARSQPRRPPNPRSGPPAPAPVPTPTRAPTQPTPPASRTAATPDLATDLSDPEPSAPPTRDNESRRSQQRRSPASSTAAAPSPQRSGAPSGGSPHASDTTGPSNVKTAAPGVEEWEDMQAALEASEREEREAALREERHALEQVRLAEEREAAEIAEALRMVDEAMQREAMEEATCWERMQAAEATGVTVEQQLAILMELGFHAELAAPVCDGATPIEELVEKLMSMSTLTGGLADTASVGASHDGGDPVFISYASGSGAEDVFPERRQSQQGRRWIGAGVAKRFGMR